jgi:3-oxoacid CoA-transferase A subunit
VVKLTMQEAIGKVARGDTLMIGGFGLVGQPVELVERLLENPHATDLTIISNNLGEAGAGLGRLLTEGQIVRAVGSYFTSNRDAVRAYVEGRLEIELLPQGTLAEAIRAGGAGIGGFYIRTAAGTELADGRETRQINGQTYVLQYPLTADIALVRAQTADELGNLAYAKTARNFNPDMASAARVVIAQVDEIVSVGELAPERIVTPHILVDHLVLTD